MGCCRFLGQQVELACAGLELHGAEVAQFRVPSAQVVEALDVVEDVRLAQHADQPRLLALQAGPERCCGGRLVVSAISHVVAGFFAVVGLKVQAGSTPVLLPGKAR